MKNTRNILGENIRRIRKELGWTQTDLAVESGISFRGVNEIETGKRSPRTDTLAAIAGALKVPESILYSKELPSNFKVQDIPKRHPEAHHRNVCEGCKRPGFQKHAQQ